jgi:transcriptional regulator with XRE-family HTH domain
MALEPPVDARELADWLRDLKQKSGLSYAAIAREIGEDERNVKRWMPETGEPNIPSGDVVLRLLVALGVMFDPPLPMSVAPMQLRLREIEKGLGELIEQLSAEDQAAHEEESAEGRPNLDRRLEEVAEVAAENFEIVKAQLADVARRLPPEADQGHTDEEDQS